MCIFCLHTDALQHGAQQFETSAGKLKRKYWWKNLKVYFGFCLVSLHPIHLKPCLSGIACNMYFPVQYCVIAKYWSGPKITDANIQASLCETLEILIISCRNHCCASCHHLTPSPNYACLLSNNLCILFTCLYCRLIIKLVIPKFSLHCRFSSHWETTLLPMPHV